MNNGKKEGKGRIYYKNGDKYEGDGKNNKKEGKGIYYWNNGNTYWAINGNIKWGYDSRNHNGGYFNGE